MNPIGYSPYAHATPNPLLDTRPDRREAVLCTICPNHCALQEGQTGLCRARIARHGRVESCVYGAVSALALDPIEKKPLAKFQPGSKILSVGGYGCNLRCPFCQNYEISQTGSLQAGEDAARLTPQQLVQRALQLVPQGNIGIAYTYNEPVVNYEFLLDTARLAHQSGLKNVLISNGYICPEPLQKLLPYFSAFNIDLKCFTQDGYSMLGGALEPVKNTIQIASQTSGLHLEVTTLVVPGFSDNEQDMHRQASWLASLSPAIPLHISRYFPNWQAQANATSPALLQGLKKIAEEYLQFVFLGNCP